MHPTPARTAEPPADLLGLGATDRDWQQRAWERLRDVRAKHHGWTLDQALAHETIGRVVRAFAAQLRAEAAASVAREARAARFGRQVVHNGFGFVPRFPARRA